MQGQNNDTMMQEQAANQKSIIHFMYGTVGSYPAVLD